MREHDALENNPQVSRKALEAVHSQLFGWALSRCAYDAAAAEDLMQTAYIEILSGKARFANKSTLKTGRWGGVQNLARRHVRQLATRLRLIKTYAADPADWITDDKSSDHYEQRRIWQAVENLPQRQRDVTELVFCRDMTIEEASSVMGVTLGTARVHYDRAKKALAENLASLKQKESVQ